MSDFNAVCIDDLLIYNEELQHSIDDHVAKLITLSSHCAGLEKELDMLQAENISLATKIIELLEAIQYYAEGGNIENLEFLDARIDQILSDGEEK